MVGVVADGFIIKIKTQSKLGIRVGKIGDGVKGDEQTLTDAAEA